MDDGDYDDYDDYSDGEEDIGDNEEEDEEKEEEEEVEKEEEEEEPDLDESFKENLHEGEDEDLNDLQKLLINRQKQTMKTQKRLTKYEKAAIIGFRAQQIAEGTPIMVVVDHNMIDASAIAEKEFEQGEIPLAIER